MLNPEQALPPENQWDLLVEGVGGTVRAPFKRHRHRPRLSRGQKDVTAPSASAPSRP